MPAEVVNDAVDAVAPAGTVALAVVLAVVAALVLGVVVSAVVRSVARRHSLAMPLLKRARRPMQVSLVIVAVWVALRVSSDAAPWRVTAEHVLLVALICSITWLVAALAFVAEDAVLARYRTDVPDNRHARRVRTQVTVLRRLAVAVLALCAVAGILMTFPGARTAGASLFASAGLLSVIAGLAAQSTLANVFAGLQLAFTDAIRVEDVVVVEGEWGRIEEITMTYIVVHLWDDRRLILPSTYFTTTPFQNWTRRAAELLGTVELDLDWTVPVDDMRHELTRLLDASDLWDGRVGVLQVTEATGGLVRVRALASAVDAPTLFDLRCHVREELVDWLQRTQPHALPRARVEGSLDGADGRAGAQPRLPALRRPATGASGAVGVDGDAPVGAHVPITLEVTAVRPVEDDVPDDPPDDVADADVTDEDELDDVRALDGATVPVRRPALDATRGDPRDVGERTARLGRTDDSRLFTGVMGAQRAQLFTGPGKQVMDERERTAEQGAPPPLDPVRDAEREDARRRIPREDGVGGDGAGEGP
jgi:small-conductance mechanosensitive channel